MVRAILAGSKTQTRRAIKPKPDLVAGSVVGFRTPGDEKRGRLAKQIPCPYGAPGDRLWVREAWQSHTGQMGESIVYAYRATDDKRLGPWRPSIFMPRDASRITLEVTEVRVERLQDISEADARAEGVWTGQPEMLAAGARGMNLNHRSAYASLWEQINGPASWDANPWVWAISFKRVTP